MEVHIHINELSKVVAYPTEVDVSIIPLADTREYVDPVAKTFSKLLLECIRTALRVNTKGRGHQRLIWAHALRLWPIYSGGRTGEPVNCMGKDLSLNGIGFYMPGDAPPKVVRLQLPKTDLTPAMNVMARIVRVKAASNGWQEVGAILLAR